MNYKLLYFPNKILISKCLEVETKELSDNVLKCVKEMRNTMLNVEGFFKNNALGISANQVGYDLRIILISKTPNTIGLKNRNVEVLINPVIKDLSDEMTTKWEGCLSEKDFMYLKKRHKFAFMEYTNLKGIRTQERLSEKRTRIFLHEMDHLDGIEINNHEVLDRIEIEKLNDMEFYIKWADLQENMNLLL